MRRAAARPARGSYVAGAMVERSARIRRRRRAARPYRTRAEFPWPQRDRARRAGLRMSATPAIVGWRHGNPLEHLLEREWLVTNGLGGYASGSLSGGCTRRYHGTLIAALPAPHGRTVFVPFIDERLTGRRGSVRLSAIETTTETCLPDSEWISEIGLECGLPVWRYRHGSTAIEKTIAM